MNPFANIQFPVYRMYVNGLTWIRIDSPTGFTEIRKIGSRYERTVYEARILPDRNLILDLVFNYLPFAQEIQSDVFNQASELASK